MPERGAPQGNKNAAKYRESTQHVGFRLPVSIVERLNIYRENKGFSQGQAVADILDKSLPKALPKKSKP